MSVDNSTLALLLSFSFGVSLPLIWLTGRWVKTRLEELEKAAYINAFFSGINTALGFGNMITTAETANSARYRTESVESGLRIRLDSVQSTVDTLKLLLKSYIDSRAAETAADSLAEMEAERVRANAAPAFSFGLNAQTANVPNRRADD